MKFAKWIVMGSGGVILAVASVILVSPKTAHALAAALVQITNTRSNPVPTQDVDIAARHPYTATCYVFGNPGAFITCQPVPAPPSSGYETVIQNVNVSLNQDTGSVQPVVTDFSYATAGNSFQLAVPIGAQGVGEWAGNMPTTAYVDPTGSYNPLQCASLFNNGTATMTCTISGYSVAIP
jgi:hypothetical protein